jgi:hypothetical protein
VIQFPDSRAFLGCPDRQIATIKKMSQPGMAETFPGGQSGWRSPVSFKGRGFFGGVEASPFLLTGETQMFLPIFPTPRFFVAGERIRQLLSRERMPANDPSEAWFNRVESGSRWK